MRKSESVRSVLLELTFRRELILWTTEAQYRQSLSERCPNREHEIELIALAIQHGIVGEMLRLCHGMAPSILLPKLVRWLNQQSGLCMRDAVWAVESWAMALGVLAFSDSNLPLNEKY